MFVNLIIASRYVIYRFGLYRCLSRYINEHFRGFQLILQTSWIQKYDFLCTRTCVCRKKEKDFLQKMKLFGFLQTKDSKNQRLFYHPEEAAAREEGYAFWQLFHRRDTPILLAFVCKDGDGR